jgi:hypothetical protein
MIIVRQTELKTHLLLLQDIGQMWHRSQETDVRTDISATGFSKLSINLLIQVTLKHIYYTGN